MASAEFVNHWSVKWGDLLQVSRAKLVSIMRLKGVPCMRSTRIITLA